MDMHLTETEERLTRELVRVKWELDAAREHLALVVEYYESEARAGDGVPEEHWGGLMSAKAFLAAARGER